jgi:hypothetical protein
MSGSHVVLDALLEILQIARCWRPSREEDLPEIGEAMLANSDMRGDDFHEPTLPE